MTWGDDFDWTHVKRHSDGRVLLLYRHQRIFDEGLVKRGSRALDVGGWGVLATAIEEAGVECTIFDADTDDQAYSARMRAHRHVIGDVTTYDDPSWAGRFDLITCFETLEHVGNAEAAVANMASWLTPDGVFVGTVPKPGVIHYEGEPGVTIVYPDQLRNYLVRGGLEVESIELTGSRLSTDPPGGWYFRARKIRA